MRNIRTSILILTVAVFGLVPTSRASEPRNLDEALAQRAPDIVKYLRDKNYQTVGVLKFLVQKGAEPATDNVGTLNLSVARRLEVALVLANPDDKLGIVRNASAAVMNSRRRASYLSPAGRKELFNVPFILAWGTNDDEPVKADAFVTGLVQLSPDLATTSVRIQAFDKDQDQPVDVCQFRVRTDERMLTETGESYLVRQIVPGKGDAARSAKETEQGKAKHPLEASDLQWEVYYDNDQAPIVIKDGRASVKGPKQGQIVWFVLTNKGKERYGVVLRVNGENTLYREKLPSSLCRKWILDPGDKVVIRGYQSDDKTAAEFSVLSPEASEKEEVNYGEHAGTFSLEVFAGRKEPAPVAAEDAKVKAVEAGQLPTAKPIKLTTLQQKLLEAQNSPAKVSDGLRQIPGRNGAGLVVAGKAIDSQVERVKFEPAPVPMISATVRYYAPGR